MKREMMPERSAEAFASGEGVRLCLTDEVIPCKTGARLRSLARATRESKPKAPLDRLRPTAPTELSE